MSQLCQFTKIEDGTPVYVNPWRVKFVRANPAAAGTGTEICLDGERITVKEQLDAVVKTLNKGAKKG
jgi:hypothetical protein